jgi:uncharacterized OB-fold protein
MKKRASKKMVGIKCQCQDRPVPIEKEKVVMVQCPSCGKVYKTNRDDSWCFDCRKKSR